MGKPRSFGVGGLLAFVVAVSACSDDGGEGAAVGDQVSADDLEEAVSAYTDAFGQGDAEAAWSMVSARCQDVLNEEEYQAAVAASGELYSELHVISVESSIDGTSADVNYEVSVSELSQTNQRWVIDEGGGWRWDGC